MNAEAAQYRSIDWYLDHFTADVERLAAVVEHSDPGLPIAACPGWDLQRLVEHLGQVHRWANFCATNGRPPSADLDPPMEAFEPDGVADWLRRGGAVLATTLRDLDPEATTWHPFPVEQVARVWPRRQAHETAMHRWDAEHAAGLPATIDAELASDGIDEYLEVLLPRAIGREGNSIPTGSLHLHCTDVDGEWLVRSEDGEYRMVRAHQKGDAALRGPAEPMLLTLWGRSTDRADELNPVGDEAVIEAWQSAGQG